MPTSKDVKRVIFDCDLGTDDAVALYLLLLAEMEGKVKIEMIVCTRGNASLYHVCRNVVRMLEYANRTDIPIYRGSNEVLVPRTEEDEFYHGVDGFGDLSHETEPDTSIIRPEPAVVAMRDLVINNPHEITLLVIGPMTNCALLMRMFEGVAEQIKEINIMGGNHFGVGNVAQAAEFNFYMDPEAAHIAITSAKCPINLLTWETCFYTRIPMAWRMKELGGQKGGKTWQLIYRAETSIYKDPRAHWMPADAFLILVLLYPETVLQQSQEHVDVELAGKLTRGQVAIDHLHKKKPNVNVIREIDYKYFQKVILEAHTKL